MQKILFAMLAMLTLAACNTMEGLGEDVSAAGDAVADEAEETQRDM